MNINLRKALIIGVLLSFLLNTFWPLPVYAQEFYLPAPGQMVALSPSFSPAVLKGIKLDPKNPFRFHFFVDSGDSKLSQEELRAESTKLIKYFLASLTIPEKDLGVNLSPYEKDRIVSQEFGQTEMGRDLLAEDYLLKQITASLIYPESQLGKEFWTKVYAQAQAKYGTTNIPINTFNKVWIVPEKAVVYENGGVAFVLENHLKVMLEQDYLSLAKHEGIQSGLVPDKDTNQLGSQIVREIVIPALTKEVNEGKNFAQLRQVFYSLILATWYKKKIKDSIFNKIYSNRNKIGGVNVSAGEKGRIYQEYLKAFKKGVFNYIQEESDPTTNRTIPRKYFSGGVDSTNFNLAMIVLKTPELNRNQRNEILTQHGLINALVDFAMQTTSQETTLDKNSAIILNGGARLYSRLSKELIDQHRHLGKILKVKGNGEESGIVIKEASDRGTNKLSGDAAMIQRIKKALQLLVEMERTAQFHSVRMLQNTPEEKLKNEFYDYLTDGMNALTDLRAVLSLYERGHGRIQYKQDCEDILKSLELMLSVYFDEKVRRRWLDWAKQQTFWEVSSSDSRSRIKYLEIKKDDKQDEYQKIMKRFKQKFEANLPLLEALVHDLTYEHTEAATPSQENGIVNEFPPSMLRVFDPVMPAQAEGIDTAKPTEGDSQQPVKGQGEASHNGANGELLKGWYDNKIFVFDNKEKKVTALRIVSGVDIQQGSALAEAISKSLSLWIQSRNVDKRYQ